LGIVDQAKKRSFLSDSRKQMEHSEAHEEAIRCRSGAEAKRDLQSVALGTWEFPEVVQHGRAQLLDTSEGELRLGLDADGSLDSMVKGTRR
jgi:hypothetical protein